MTEIWIMIIGFLGAAGGYAVRDLLARGETRWRKGGIELVDHIPQLVWVSDASGRVEYFNRRWTEYAGIESREDLGRAWRTLVHPDDLPGLRTESDRTSREGVAYEHRCRMRGKDGRYRWFIIKSHPGKDAAGRVKRWFGTCIDIHDLIAAESELKLSRDRLQMALAAGKMAAWETDLATGEVARTESHDQLYGYDQRQARWTFHDFISALHEEDRERVVERIQRARGMDGKDMFADEFRIRWPDGSVHWLASRAQYRRDRDGNAASVGGILVDITDIKRAEASLEAAKVAAEAASSAKSQFLANVSHELRTPLGAILGFQRMLRDATISGDERHQYLEIIERNGTALMQLIDDLLDHSRLEAKSLSIEKIAFELNELIDDVMQVGGLKAEEKGVLLRLTRDPAVPGRITSDPTRFRQVLGNLVVNAVKFTERGEVHVAVGARDGAALVFDIRDTGIGISPNERQALFAPFQQGDAGTTRRFGGTGLGLALSRDLARAMGGDVELISSEKNRGTWFRITLPLEIPDEAAVTARSAKPVREAARLDGLRVLIVDDSADNQLLMKRMLDRAGAVVAVAGNGLEALRAAEGVDYDVVLMDMQMPVLDGLTATRRLRESGFRRPIVALTAHALREEREKCLAAGCDDHVSKPVDFGRLNELLLSFSNRSQSTRAHV